MSAELRTCSDCGKAKPLSEFHAPSWIKGKLYYKRQCKACYNARSRKRYANNPEKRALQIAWSLNASSRRQHLEPLDAPAVAQMILSATHCAYCGQPNDGTVPFAVDHYIPVKLGGTNELSNIRVCCEPCNRAKHDSHPDDYLLWLSGVIHRKAQ